MVGEKEWGLQKMPMWRREGSRGGLVIEHSSRDGSSSGNYLFSRLATYSAGGAAGTCWASEETSPSQAMF